MPTLRFQIPKAQDAVIDPATGCFTRVWYNFLADMSARVATNLPDLAGGSTLAQTITAYNDLLDVLKVSYQMEPD